MEMGYGAINLHEVNAVYRQRKMRLCVATWREFHQPFSMERQP
jgi:hypothetical protein